MNFRSIILLLAVVTTSGSLYAREPDRGFKSSKKSSLKALAEGCAAATSSADLSINNVRARILGSGDMWWDLNDAQYEVPKGSNKHSMFAGALWLGGIDKAGQLRLAAMTYRQDGVDYWPGPLSTDNTASVTAATCERYNQHWVIYREQVETHKAWLDCKFDPDCELEDLFPDGYTIPNVIVDWPGNGVDNELPNKLAPYFEPYDNGVPGLYEPEFDYPAYDLDGNLDCQQKEVDILYGDETIWWVYNDKGNVHTETEAAALGFEIRAQAFAFTSNDEVNNMTFNNYRIINRSTFELTNTYFGTWFDPDLGNAEDDIIGSDIARGLGYCYNADNNDQGANGYGLNPPAVGFDFFQGPFADYFDGLDNDRDGCVDAVLRNDTCRPENPATGVNERIIMSGFMYYNRAGTGPDPRTSDPDVAGEFYNLLQSKWKGGNDLIIENPSGKGSTENGDGFVAGNTGEKTLFAYPGESFDTTGAYEPDEPISWWESPDNLADKRGLHTAGPFSLQPGALNFITTGTVWARNFNANDLFASVNDVIIADDKAQQLFDNCFQVLDGPTSPLLEIVELDKKLILKLENAFTPQTIGYKQADPAIPLPDSLSEAEAFRRGYNTYDFEGFQIFQVSGPNVSIGDIYNPSRSRLIWQSDLKNDVGQLVNFEEDPMLENGALRPVDRTLEANNNGIELTFEVTEDAFAEGEKQLVNYREYYFFVIAYAQNQYKIIDPRNITGGGQAEPYLAGRKIGNGTKPYVGIPATPDSRSGGLLLRSEYGEGLPVTRLSGAGNSGNFLRITDETRIQIAQNFDQNEVEYLPGNGPVNIKVVDPKQVTPGDFILEFTGVAPTDGWVVYDAVTQQAIAESEGTLSFDGEQIIDELGISISLSNVRNPGFDTTNAYNNGFIGAEIIYEDEAKPWFSGVPDVDLSGPQNWILGGNASVSDDATLDFYYNSLPGDQYGILSSILGGTVAPFRLTSDVTYEPNGTPPLPGYGIRPDIATSAGKGITPLNELPNIDLVITKDQSLWTRVPVFELGNDDSRNEGNTDRFQLRSDITMEKTGGGQIAPDPNRSTYQTGWSWFPGYAVDVETGKRLLLAFGENSWLKNSNGGDMRWNPTSNLSDKLGTRFEFGGMHVIYIFNHEATFFGSNTPTDISYQGDAIEDNPLVSRLNNLTNIAKLEVFNSIAWASYPLTASEQFEFMTYDQIPTDMQMSIRVNNRFQQTASEPNNGYPLYNFSTDGLGAETNVTEIARDALENVRVVPNPYYGYSDYENSQLENVVRITNLPETATIRIYQTNGTLIRTLNKADRNTFIEWDLRNSYNVPIASGVYLLHIDAGEAGETVVKWMGSLAPVDLNAF